MFTAMRSLWELLLLMLITVFSKTIGTKPNFKFNGPLECGYCLSWRVAVEANNVRAWHTVPAQCLRYVENYMLGGQYAQDLDMVVEQIVGYMKDLLPIVDGKDAWILDVDDTCISNLLYYSGKRFGKEEVRPMAYPWWGLPLKVRLALIERSRWRTLISLRGDPYDPTAFKMWAKSKSCPAIPAVHRLFKMLIDGGYKVILLTGRDEETLGAPTIENLHNQGFIGYERVILRSSAYKGQSAVSFKSEMRRQLVGEGYRIRGNIGDQWSDLLGDYLGDRTFKLPNPMYFVP